RQLFVGYGGVAEITFGGIHFPFACVRRFGGQAERAGTYSNEKHVTHVKSPLGELCASGRAVARGGNGVGENARSRIFRRESVEILHVFNAERIGPVSAGAKCSGEIMNFDQAPMLVIWEVTQACDLACVHCRASAQPERNPKELTTEQGY